MATDPEATQSSVSIVRKRPQRAAGQRRRLSPQPRRLARLRDAERALRRDLAQGRCAVPRRRRVRRRLSPTVDTFTLGASVQDGKIERGLVALEVEANRVEQHGFGAGELDRAKQVDARELRPRLRRARQDRERIVRAGVREPLPRRASPALASSTSRSWCRRWCRRSPPRTWRRRPRRCSPTPAASSWRVAAEGGHQGADRRAAQGGDHVGRRRRRDAVDRYRQQRHAHRRARRIRERSSTAARFPSSASRSSASRTASRRG